LESPRVVVAQRVLIVGPAGSGKSTTAAELARRSRLPNVELDALMLGPRWSRADDASFRERVAELATDDEWIVSGNYAGVRDVLWRRAELVLWLDLPKRTVLRRLLWRTVRRVLTREDLGGGNRETLSRVFGRQSIIAWALRSHSALRAEYERAVDVYAGRATVVRCRTASAQRWWLRSARAATASELPHGTRDALVCEPPAARTAGVPRA
jgi:adenylate kinase family enzyme